MPALLVPDSAGPLDGAPPEGAEEREDESGDEQQEEQLRERDASADGEDDEQENEKPEHGVFHLRVVTTIEIAIPGSTDRESSEAVIAPPS